MQSNARISDSEWKVMEAVWKDPPMKARQVVGALAERENWKPQTVKTLLARLVKKGALRHEAEGNHYLYHPEISRERAIADETNSFLERVCHGSLTPMLAHLVDTRRPLEDDEIEALSTLLDEKSGRGEKKLSESTKKKGGRR
jgi:BlaI family penicillinase repressor